MSKMDIVSPSALEKRITELEEERAELEETVKSTEATLAFAELNEANTEEEQEDVATAKAELEMWDNSSEQEELKELMALRDEMGSSWDNDEALINDKDWVEYAQNLIEDIGDLPKDLPSYIVIDWDATADNVKQDYSSVDFQGNTYYYRNV